MNRKTAKDLLPIIRAFVEGKDIEIRSKNPHAQLNGWTKMDEFIFGNFEYRIKPEPKYRPFANAEECLSEMQKHQPFGWIKNGGYWYNIITTGVMSVKIIDTRGAITTLYFSDLLAHYRFADGTPFGVKTEEG